MNVYINKIKLFLIRKLNLQESWMDNYHLKSRRCIYADDQMCMFKYQDYTTEMVGRRYKSPYKRDMKNPNDGGYIYYIQRGDGSRIEYGPYGITDVKLLGELPWLIT